MVFILIASIPDKSLKNMNNKALININQEPYINHQIKNLLKINKRAKIFVVCAFESKKILDNMIKNHRVYYINHEYNDCSNVGESLKSVISHIPDDTTIHIINLSMAIDPSVIKNIKFKQSSILVNHSIRFKSKIGCIIDKSNNAEFIFYDLPNRICEYLYITKQDNKRFKNIINNYVKNTMYLFEVINTIIYHNIDIEAVKIKSNIIHFNQIEQIPNIKNLFKKLQNVSTI